MHSTLFHNIRVWVSFLPFFRPTQPPTHPPLISLSAGFALMLGLASFSRGYHDNKDTHSGWSYTVGWIAFLFSLVCAAYFILVAVHRMRMSNSIKSRRTNTSQQNSYTPLAQFEQSSGSSSEEDEKL